MLRAEGVRRKCVFTEGANSDVNKSRCAREGAKILKKRLLPSMVLLHQAGNINETEPNKRLQERLNAQPQR